MKETKIMIDGYNDIVIYTTLGTESQIYKLYFFAINFVEPSLIMAQIFKFFPLFCSFCNDGGKVN